MTNIAVILAGGSGTRVGGDIPKQFQRLADGRTVLETCVEVFEQNDRIDGILIVVPMDYLEQAKILCQKNRYGKILGFVPGGSERWQSSWKALDELHRQLPADGRNDCNVLLHDCARPFVSQRIVTDVVQALVAHEAVTVAVPVTDTIYLTDSHRLTAIPNRASVLRAQTPQAFRLSLIRKAFENALAEGNILATDDVGIVHQYMPEQSIFIVQGEEQNRKITYKEDLERIGQ